MRRAIGRQDGQAVEGDVGQMGTASGKAGEMGVVLEVADQGVLVVVVHVGDDALLRCFVRAAGGFVRHGGKGVNADRRLHEEFSTHCLLSATMKPQTVP